MLDNRLKAVASFVPRGARVADIGTDHAYLAIYIQRELGAKSVIATDKNEGPLSAARHAVAEAGLIDVISLRLGDGLAPIEAGEIDTACIAGMGGELIASILEAAPDVLAKVNRLVLQPMSDAPRLRRWLYENGWYIADETLALADGRLYEIIAAEHGDEPIPSGAALEIGPVLMKKRPEYFERHIDEILSKKRRVLSGMAKSDAARQSAKYKAIENEIKKIEEAVS